MLCDNCSSCEFTILHCIYSKQLIYMYACTYALRKHAYSNILKISPPKTESFKIKNSDIFHISTQKRRLRVPVRTASPVYIYIYIYIYIFYLFIFMMENKRMRSKYVI